MTTPLQPMAMENSKIPKPRYRTTFDTPQQKTTVKMASSTGAVKAQRKALHNDENAPTHANMTSRRHNSKIPQPGRRLSQSRPIPSSKRSLMKTSAMQPVSLPKTLASIELALHRKDASWGSQTELLQRAKTLIESERFPTKDDLACFDRLAVTMSRLLCQQRSQVVKDVCGIIELLVDRLDSKTFGELSPKLIPELLRLACSATATHLVGYSRVCLEKLFQNCHQISLVEIFCDPSNSFLLRGGCGNLLVDLIMREWNDEEIEEQANLIEERVKVLSNQVFSDAATHKQCRWATYHFMHFRFSRAEALFAALREDDQRTMETEYVDFHSKMELFGGIEESLEEDTSTECVKDIVAMVSPAKVPSPSSLTAPNSAILATTVDQEHDELVVQGSGVIETERGASTPTRPVSQPSRLEQLVTWKLNQMKEKDVQRRHRLSISDNRSRGSSIASMSTCDTRTGQLPPPLPPADLPRPTPDAVKKYRALRTREQLYMSPSLKEYIPTVNNKLNNEAGEDVESLLAIEPKPLTGAVASEAPAEIPDHIRAVASMVQQHSSQEPKTVTAQSPKKLIPSQIATSLSDSQVTSEAPPPTPDSPHVHFSRTAQDSNKKMEIPVFKCIDEEGNTEHNEKHEEEEVTFHEDSNAEMKLKAMLDSHDRSVGFKSKAKFGMKAMRNLSFVAVVAASVYASQHPEVVSEHVDPEIVELVLQATQDATDSCKYFYANAALKTTEFLSKPEVQNARGVVEHATWASYVALHKHVRPIALRTMVDAELSISTFRDHLDIDSYLEGNEYLQSFVESALPTVAYMAQEISRIDDLVLSETSFTSPVSENDSAVIQEDEDVSQVEGVEVHEAVQVMPEDAVEPQIQVQESVDIKVLEEELDMDEDTSVVLMETEIELGTVFHTDESVEELQSEEAVNTKGEATNFKVEEQIIVEDAMEELKESDFIMDESFEAVEDIHFSEEESSEHQSDVEEEIVEVVQEELVDSIDEEIAVTVDTSEEVVSDVLQETELPVAQEVSESETKIKSNEPVLKDNTSPRSELAGVCLIASSLLFTVYLLNRAVSPALSVEISTEEETEPEADAYTTVQRSPYSPMNILGDLVGRFNAVEIVQDGKTPQVTIKPVRRSRRTASKAAAGPLNVVLDASSIQFANSTFGASSRKTPRGVPMEIDTPHVNTRTQATIPEASNHLMDKFNAAEVAEPSSALRRSSRKNFGKRSRLYE